MTNFNTQLTQLIRASRSGMWGNWALNSQIKPGAVGYIDPETGEFKLVVDALPGTSIEEVASTQEWKLHSANTKRSDTDLGADGSVIDPQTGLKISVELEVKWGFETSGALSSEFSLQCERRIKDLIVIDQQKTWLAEQAATVGFADGQGISQGFGVITNVLYAASGVNLGSNEDKSSFSVAGSLKGIHALLGDKGPEAQAKGSYALSTSSNQIDSHIWPATANSESAEPMPIAFEFTSFDKLLMIPSWVKKVGSLELFFDSTFGSTYMCRVKVGYDVDGERVDQKFTVTGGLSKSVGDIPLAARNIKVDIEFVGVINSDHYSCEWATPLGQWLNGQRHIDMWGVWPGKTHFQVREETPA